jgi:chitinase
VAADQAGNTTFAAATQVTQSVTIAKAAQTITFGAQAAQTYAPAGTFSLNPVATGGASGVAIVYSSITTGVCTVVGTTVTIVSVGTCTIAADQASNTNYNAAAQATQNITINQATQTITFNTVTSVLPGAAAITLNATGGASGNPVTFASQTTGICTTTGTNGATLSFVANATGMCTVRASQAGNANYNAAADVNRSITVAAAPAQAVPSTTSVSVSSGIVFGDVATITATVAGTNPTGTVSFTLAGSEDSTEVCAGVTLVAGGATCTVAAGSVNAGRYTVTARYSGNTNNGSSSGTAVMEVTRRPTSASISVSPTTVVAGRPVTITVLVMGARAGGTVAFIRSGEFISTCASVPLRALNLTPSGSSTISGAFTAACTIPFAAAGSSTVAAAYSGDTNNTPSQASTTVQVSAANAPTIQNTQDLSNMWWAGPAENGWGIAILQRGSVQFNALYVYDAQGRAQWFVQPGTTYDAATRTYRGNLYQPTGSPFAAYNASGFVPGAPIGFMTQTVSADGSTITLNYTINGVSGTKILVPQSFSDTGSAPPLPVGDLWWGGTADPRENGWGINISQQGNGLFTTWYTYAPDGKTTWFVMPSGSWTGLTYSGDLYSTTGSPWLGATYDPTRLNVTKVGTMTFTFTDANNATVTYTVNGVTQTKVINRQPF